MSYQIIGRHTKPSLIGSQSNFLSVLTGFITRQQRTDRPRSPKTYFLLTDGSSVMFCQESPEQTRSGQHWRLDEGH